MDLTNKKGEIITFYSFKGGTGRTMALANIAVLSARIPKKVLMIDWDLEAPGLHKFFNKYVPSGSFVFNSKPGIIDFFIEFREKADILATNTKASERQINDILNEIDFSKYLLDLSLSGISLVKAGSLDHNYAKKVNQFQWEQFFHSFPNFFPIFTEFLRDRFDYIFIDSRTGFTDTSGICTMLLPEKLCLIFTPNQQSLEGVKDLAIKALNYRMNSNDFRPLKIYPVPSRVELAEKDLRDLWRKGSNKSNINGFQPIFENIFDIYYGTNNCDLTTYFDAIQIHHEPKFSYGEEIAVLTETYSDRLSLTTVYSSLLQKLFFDNKIFSERNYEDSDSSSKIRLFISSASADEEFVSNLKNEIKKFGKYSVITLNESATPGTNIFSEIEKNIANSHVFLPVVSEEYLKSNYSEFEVHSFLKNKRTNEISLAIPIYTDPKSVPTKSNSWIFSNFKGLYFNQNNHNISSLAGNIVNIIEENKNLFISNEL